MTPLGDSSSITSMNISTRDSCDAFQLSSSPVPSITWPYIAAELLIALLAIAGNFLVCLAVNRNRKLRTVTNYFLVSLSVADIFVGVLAIPCAVLTDLGEPRHNLPLCLLLLSVLIVLTQSSILSLLAVAAERYVAILLPLQYQRIVSPRNARLALILTWCLALFSGSIPLMGWHESLPPSGACLFPCVVNLSYMVYFNFLGCVLVPLVVMFIIYGHIFLTVRQQLRRIAAGRGPARPDTRDGERGPARPDTTDGEMGPARSDTRDGERGQARPDTRDGESGPARPDTRDGEMGPARPDTRDEEMGPARPDIRDGEMGPARPDIRDGEMGTARPDTRDGEMGPARPDIRDGEMGPDRPDIRDGESGPARPDTSDGESGPARPDTRDGESGPARPDTRDGESGPARPDTRDGESGPARPDTRDGESGLAWPDTRDGESGPARPDTRDGERGPAWPDTREGERGPAWPDTRDCGTGAGSRVDDAGAGKRARVEFGAGKTTRVEAGAGKTTRVEAGAGKRARVEAGAGKRARVEAGAGKRARVEAWGVSGVSVWGGAGNKWSEGESWSGNAAEMTSHASGCVRTDSGSVVASESKSESRGPMKDRCGSGVSEYKRTVRMRREVRKATSLFLVLFLFMLCWLPLHFLNCVTLMCPRCHVPLPLTLAAILLSHANSALNPLLYAYRMRSFRHTLRALCCTHTA
ncbi:collagen alpha-1(I) chain-like isoform X2 [Oncorhynchus mykiss]|uniref:collagen alpha-1(I) chain-like isoform X2 n=1 Tax=Oncorhynchus mykiss TaxID=8022 RepID=UPI0018783EBC|nr:collagen alpha-1(I) chain-like isoform X2 [Oncorhynchus mykiss]